MPLLADNLFFLRTFFFFLFLPFFSFFFLIHTNNNIKTETMNNNKINATIFDVIKKSDTAFINKFEEGECEQLAGEITDAVCNMLVRHSESAEGLFDMDQPEHEQTQAFVTDHIDMSEGGSTLYVNKYRCPECKNEWTDVWSCACNDKCSVCNKEIEPYESKET